MNQLWIPLVAIVLGIAFVGGLVALGGIVKQSPVRLKEFAIGLGIAILLPLVAHYTGELMRPSPSEEIHQARVEKLQIRLKAAKTPAQKDVFVDQKAALEVEYKEAEKRHEQAVFAVAYPLGIVALVLGALISIPSVGGGFMFGGLFALTDGCYSYWDSMPGWLRLGSLLGALAVLVVLGCWKREHPPQPATDHFSADNA
jgi:hypothetical protein